MPAIGRAILSRSAFASFLETTSTLTENEFCFSQGGTLLDFGFVLASNIQLPK